MTPTPNSFKYINAHNVVFRDNGQVYEGTMTRQTITRGADMWNIKADIKTADGTAHDIEAFNIYESIEHYRADCHIAFADGHLKFTKYYTIENGQVKAHDCDTSVIFGDIADNGRWHFKTSESAIGSRVFYDRDCALQMAKTKYIDNEGKEREREGLLNLLMLTDEQQKALCMFKEAITQLKALGVELAYNHDYGTLFAYNGKNVKDTATCYYDDITEGWEVAEVTSGDVADLFEVKTPFRYMADEYRVIVRTDETDAK